MPSNRRLETEFVSQILVGSNLGSHPGSCHDWATAFAADIAEHYHDVMNLGMPEMIFIFLLALVIFGPKKLPELGRQLGKALGEFKKASNEFKNQLETEMMNIELEERAKQVPDTSPKILPAEKVFDTVSVPPMESIPREPLSLSAEPAPVEPATPPPGSAESPPVSPSVTNAPGQNA